jgi:hypothetical protein
MGAVTGRLYWWLYNHSFKTRSWCYRWRKQRAVEGPRRDEPEAESGCFLDEDPLGYFEGARLNWQLYLEGRLGVFMDVAAHIPCEGGPCDQGLVPPIWIGGDVFTWPVRGRSSLDPDGEYVLAYRWREDA